MTWKEFKTAIDEEIDEQGKTEDIEIDWIDVGAYLFDKDTELNIHMQDKLTVSD